MQVQLKRVSFPPKILFQLCYPHILRGDDKTIALLNNNEEQGGSGY